MKTAHSNSKRAKAKYIFPTVVRVVQQLGMRKINQVVGQLYVCQENNYKLYYNVFKILHLSFKLKQIIVTKNGWTNLLNVFSWN